MEFLKESGYQSRNHLVTLCAALVAEMLYILMCAGVEEVDEEVTWV